MDDKIRVGIVGCGVVAPVHIEGFLQNKDVEISWACDIIEEKARKLKERYAIKNTTTRYQDVLDDSAVDCITICTDHASHAPIAADAFAAGKHVLCEKALAHTREAMDKMCEAHRDNPELVFSGIFQHRFDPSISTLKHLVSKGTLGILLNAGVQMRCLRTDEYYHGDDWRGTWVKEGGSVLINQSIHFIDALLWIVGGAKQVCGAHANRTHAGVIETEDCAAAALRLQCGALGTIEATASSHLRWEPTISLHGSEGSIEVRDGQPVKLLFESKQLENQVWQQLRSAERGQAPVGAKDYYGTGHPAQIADFLDAIKSERPPFISGEDARHAVDVVLSIYDSHRSGGWISLNGRGAKGLQGKQYAS